MSKIKSLVLGVAMAALVSSAYAADLGAAPPPPPAPAAGPDPIVEILSVPGKVLGAIANTLAPAPAPVVAKY